MDRYLPGMLHVSNLGSPRRYNARVFGNMNLKIFEYHSRLTCDKPHDDKEIQSSTQNQLFCATFNYNYTSATLTMIFWNFRFGSFFGIVRLERTLANFRSVSFAWKLSPGIFRFETFVWDLSLWNFRLGSFVW